MREITSMSPLRDLGLVGLALSILLWPVHLILSLVHWFLSEVVARIIALPFQTWDAIWRYRRVARQRAEMQSRVRLIQEQERAAIRLMRTPFMEALRLVDEFDRKQAALNPQFLTSLEISRAICEAATTMIPDLTTDPMVQRRLLEAISQVLAVDE